MRKEKKANIITITESILVENYNEALKPYMKKNLCWKKITEGTGKCLIKKCIKYKRLKNDELPNSSFFF